ncbi:MAG: hypothetical protein BWY43_00006 [candidate division WS2 bacterium ADurb.Bin280]|uniref:Uncharacterized protein n=1 Tax=candidate division WS2 bacterium ADurb.Bin280 TaxID=1852829 RepID=A0A1V5SG84_9BACT|nr:MAG: hypothetical protein BWY43_00006 [candidate division WS2 bacterium ADurb.Bin280]
MTSLGMCGAKEGAIVGAVLFVLALVLAMITGPRSEWVVPVLSGFVCLGAIAGVVLWRLCASGIIDRVIGALDPRDSLADEEGWNRRAEWRLVIFAAVVVGLVCAGGWTLMSPAPAVFVALRLIGSAIVLACAVSLAWSLCNRAYDG